MAAKYVDNGDDWQKAIAKGIVQHHDDDRWFHANPLFVELNLQLAIELRELLGKEAGFRPHLAAHILIEVLLDRALTLEKSGSLELLYEQVGRVDPEKIQEQVNQIAARSTDRIVKFFPRFHDERYLFDYLKDEGIQYRLNRVLKRVQLAPLPNSFLEWLPQAWSRVQQHQAELLPGFGL